MTQFTTGEFDDQWQLEELAQALKALVHKLPDDFAPEQWQSMKREAIVEEAVELAKEAYAAKEEEMTEAVMRQAEKQIMLWAVDNRWIRHLTDLDRLREGIGLQAFAQVDPLVAYKKEAYRHVRGLLDAIRSDTVKAVFSVQVARPQAQAQQRRRRPSQAPPSPMARNIRTNREPVPAPDHAQERPELGRNDPCWCGSGKKYKHCHMQSDLQKTAGAPVGGRHRLAERGEQSGGTLASEEMPHLVRFARYRYRACTNLL